MCVLKEIGNIDLRNKNMASRILVVALILGLGIIYVLLAFFTGIGIPCFLYEATGLLCPGCGLSRMVFAILRLDFYTAFRMNGLMFILSPFLAVFIGYAMYCYISDRPNLMVKKIPKAIYIIIIASVIIFGILRNIPAFSFLAPI